MAVSSAGLRPRSDCSGRARKRLCSVLQARPLVREGATKITYPQLSEGSFMERERLIAGPRWVPDNWTDWPTDFRS
jgi:hypothetical protein